MLRYWDKKVVSVRTVVCQDGVYPFRMEPTMELFGPASGGESSKMATEAKPTPEHQESPPETKHTDKPLSVGMKPPDKHPDGSLAMTVIGLCSVLGRYKDGDHRVTFPESGEPQEIHSIKPLPSLSDTVVDGLYGSDDGYEEEKYHDTRSSKHKSTEGKGIKTMKALRVAHRGPSQYKIWDRGKQRMKTVQYPYHEPIYTKT